MIHVSFTFDFLRLTSISSVMAKEKEEKILINLAGDVMIG